ncbi:protein-glutamine glutaminase family protein [Kitasatospora sp. NPDC059577]|uniref:scabin-related ADP-ribosyltransferase n=1 Tax=Kitasatospora sp. NPDC059577 TaxID=3346873 RepID=UPI00367EE03A
MPVVSAPSHGPVQEIREQHRAEDEQHLAALPPHTGEAPTVSPADAALGQQLRQRYPRISLVDPGSPGSGHQVAFLRVLEGLAAMGYQGEVHLTFARGKAPFYAERLGRSADVGHPRHSYDLFHGPWTGVHQGMRVTAHPAGAPLDVAYKAPERRIAADLETYWKYFAWHGADPDEAWLVNTGANANVRGRYRGDQPQIQTDFPNSVTKEDNRDRVINPTQHLTPDVLTAGAQSSGQGRTLTVFAALDAPHGEDTAAYFEENLAPSLREMTGEQDPDALILQPFLWDSHPRQIRRGDEVLAELWHDQGATVTYPFRPQPVPEDLAGHVRDHWPDATGPDDPVPDLVADLLRRAQAGEIRLVTAYYGQIGDGTVRHRDMATRMETALREIPEPRRPSAVVLLGAEPNDRQSHADLLDGLRGVVQAPAGDGSVHRLRLGRVQPAVMELFEQRSTLVVTEGANTWQEILTLATPGISARPGGETRPWTLAPNGTPSQGGQRIGEASAALGTGHTPTLTTFLHGLDDRTGEVRQYLDIWRDSLSTGANDQFRSAVEQLLGQPEPPAGENTGAATAVHQPAQAPAPPAAVTPPAQVPPPVEPPAAPHAVLPASAWADIRTLAPPARMETVRFDPLVRGQAGPGDIAGPGVRDQYENRQPSLGGLHGADTTISYDARRFEVRPGHWVTEFTLRLHLQGPDGRPLPAHEAARTLDRARDVVGDRFNERFHLPGGDQVHLRVEGAKTAPDAHRTVTVVPGNDRSDQFHWSDQSPPGVLLHEVLHFLGLPDEYVEPVTRPGDAFALRRRDLWAGENGVMGTSAHRDDFTVLPRHLQRIEEVLHSGPVLRDLSYGQHRSDQETAHAPLTQQHGQTEDPGAPAPLNGAAHTDVTHTDVAHTDVTHTDVTHTDVTPAVGTPASKAPNAPAPVHESRVNVLDGGRLYHVVSVPGDGDCLLHAVLAGARGLDGWQHGELTVHGLRELASQWFRSDAGAAMRHNADATGQRPEDRLEPHERNQTWQVHLNSGDEQPSTLSGSDLGNLRMSDLYDMGLRNRSLWNTSFYDQAPAIVAHALDLHLVVHAGNGRTEFNPGAHGGEVHVYRDPGRGLAAHYSELRPDTRGPVAVETGATVDPKVAKELAGRVQPDMVVVAMEPGQPVFRVTDAWTLRGYLLQGKIGAVKNKEGWSQLGPGLYTGHDFDHAATYSDSLSGLPVVMEFLLSRKATGLKVKNITEDWTAKEVPETLKKYDFLTDGTQFKFHPGFYEGLLREGAQSADKSSGLRIAGLKVKEGASVWNHYRTEDFVPEFEGYLIKAHQDKARQLPHGDDASGPAREPDPVPRSEALDSAPPAEPGDLRRIRYREQAEAYERRLATHLLERADVQREVKKVVDLAWAMTTNDKDRTQFGSRSTGTTGMVGTDRHMLQEVVDRGNLRERMALLYNGYTSNHFAKLVRQRQLPRPEQLKQERADRHDIGAEVVNPLTAEIKKAYGELLKPPAERGHQEPFASFRTDERYGPVIEGIRDAYTEIRGRQIAEWERKRVVEAAQKAAERQAKTILETDRNPFEVNPPLGRGEWYSAVEKDGRLGWQPGAKSFHYKLGSEFQQAAHDSGGLVVSGTSGTAFGMLQAVKELVKTDAGKTKLAELGEGPVDFEQLRLALLGWMLESEDHSFHEIMTGSRLFSESLTPEERANPNLTGTDLTYSDTYHRYRLLPPLTEQELRSEVAPEGRFPDEHLVGDWSLHDLALDSPAGGEQPAHDDPPAQDGDGPRQPASAPPVPDRGPGPRTPVPRPQSDTPHGDEITPAPEHVPNILDSDSNSSSDSSSDSDSDGSWSQHRPQHGQEGGEPFEQAQGFELDHQSVDALRAQHVVVEYQAGWAGQPFVPGPAHPELGAGPWHPEEGAPWDASVTGFDRDRIFADHDSQLAAEEAANASASDSDSDAGGAAQVTPVRWRADFGLLYRWENGARDHLEVFAEGFVPRGEDTYVPLETYLVDNPASVFVSTTRSAIHQSPGWGTAYRYLIDAPGGIDVRATLPHRQLADVEQEVAFPGGIRPEFVVGVEIVHDTALLHDPQNPDVHWYEHPVTFVPNPGYQPAHRFAHEGQHDHDSDGGVGGLGLAMAGTTIHDNDTGNHQPSADGDLVTHTIVGENGANVGRSFHTTADFALRGETHLNFPSERTTAEHQVTNPDFAPKQAVRPDGGFDWEAYGRGENKPGERDGDDADVRVPWDPKSTPYFANLHGSPEQLKVAVQTPEGKEGHQAVSYEKFGGVLRRRPSLSERPEESPIVLESCDAGLNREGLQQIADATGRTVHATTGKTYVAKESDGSTRLVLLHEPGQARPEFVTVHPTGKDTAVTGKDVHPAATDTPDPHPVTHEDGTHLLDAGDDRIPGAPMPLVRNPRDEALPHDPSAPTARQDMVPGARDLEMVEHLRRDAVVPGDRPREWGAQDHALYDHLTATDARRPFGFWKNLNEDQAAALVLAERKGLEFAAREHAVLKDRLRQATGSWSWAQNYPRDSEQALDQLIATVQDHMHTGMFVATNFFLDKPLNDNRRTTLGTSGGARSSRPEPEPTPKTVLDLMIEDPSQTFKNVWQTRASQAAVDDSRRGGVEEHFGYAATLRRDPATRNHFQDTGTDKSAFHPDEKEAARLPKYAALVSELQPRGVAVRYGSAIMRWKDDVRARATHTPKDSWSAGAMGARSVTPDSHLLPLLTYGTDFMVRRVFGEATGFQHDVEFGRRLLREGMETDEYFETQIHGDLHWKDLHSVTIVHLPEGRTADRMTGPLPTAEAARQLRDRLLAHRQDRGYDFTVDLRLHGQPPVLDRVVPHPSVPEPPAHETPAHETAPTILDSGDEITPVEHDATQHGVTEHAADDTPPLTGARMDVAGHPLDVPMRLPGPDAEDPLRSAQWGQLGELRRQIADLPEGSPEHRQLQRQIDRAQEKLRSAFTTYLDHEGSDLAAASQAREQEIARLRTQPPPAPGTWQDTHHRRLLDTLELEVRELQAELDRHALDAQSKQRMVPSARDVELVAHLQDPQKHPLDPDVHPQPLLDRLTGAGVDWNTLHPVQAAALVMVERKAMDFEQRDRVLLTEKLTTATGEWAWVAKYPRDTPQAIDRLITDVENHMRTGMYIATNFHFDQPLNANRQTAFGKAGGMFGTWGPKPKTLLDKLMADKQGLFRNAWETGASQAAVVPSRRGAVEEHFGYAPALRRSHDTRDLFQDTGSEDSRFAPKKNDRGLLPKYGALVSDLQPYGVARRYGAFALHWSDDIRGRVTHTPNDSWTAREKGALSVTSDSHVLPLLLWGDRHMVERVFGEATGFRHDPDFGERMLTEGMDTNSYFETQIHGPLSWGDLRHIVISHQAPAPEQPAGARPPRRDDSLPTPERAEKIAAKLRTFAGKNGHTFTVELRVAGTMPPRNHPQDVLAPTPAPQPHTGVDAGDAPATGGNDRLRNAVEQPLDRPEPPAGGNTGPVTAVRRPAQAPPPPAPEQAPVQPAPLPPGVLPAAANRDVPDTRPGLRMASGAFVGDEGRNNNRPADVLALTRRLEELGALEPDLAGRIRQDTEPLLRRIEERARNRNAPPLRLPVPPTTVAPLVRVVTEHLGSPLTPEHAGVLGLALTAGVGPGGANHRADVTAVGRRLHELELIDETGRTALDHLTDGASLPPAFLDGLLTLRADHLAGRFDLPVAEGGRQLAHAMRDLSHNGVVLEWRASGDLGLGRTDFATWAMDGPAEQPPPFAKDTTLNCWESVLLTAHAGGLIGWDRIHDLYAADLTGPKWTANLVAGLLPHTRTTYDANDPHTPLPRAGDIVVFSRGEHVAVATGRTDEHGAPVLLSFGVSPKDDPAEVNRVIEISAPDLYVGPAEFGPGPWSERPAHDEAPQEPAHPAPAHPESGLTPLPDAGHFGPDAEHTPPAAPPVTDRRGELRASLVHHEASGAHRLDDPGVDEQARQRMAGTLDRFPADERFLTVAMHTGTDGVPRWKGTRVTEGEVADLILSLHEQGSWDGRKPVQLVACSSARGGEQSFAAGVLRELRLRLPGLDLEIYAPSGLAWFAPPVSGPFRSDPQGPGALVVGRQVAFDSSGRPVLVEDGGWVSLTAPRDASPDAPPVVRALGAHLPADGTLPPRSTSAPEGYTVIPAQSKPHERELASNDDAVAFAGRRRKGGMADSESDSGSGSDPGEGPSSGKRIRPNESSDSDEEMASEDDTDSDVSYTSEDYRDFLQTVDTRSDRLAALWGEGERRHAPEIYFTRITAERDVLTAIQNVGPLHSVRAADALLGLLNPATESRREDLTLRRDDLARQAVPLPSADRFRALHTEVMSRYDPEGGNLVHDCELRAHALSELITAANPGIGRRHLAKVWARPEAGHERLHPDYQWNHHVAVLVETAEGSRVIDPLLFPDRAVTLAQWHDTLSVPGQGTPVVHRAPWEFFGAPNREGRSDAESAALIDGTTRAQIDAWKRDGLTPMSHTQLFGESDPKSTGPKTTGPKTTDVKGTDTRSTDTLTSDLVAMELSGKQTSDDAQAEGKPQEATEGKGKEKVEEPDSPEAARRMVTDALLAALFKTRNVQKTYAVVGLALKGEEKQVWHTPESVVNGSDDPVNDSRSFKAVTRWAGDNGLWTQLNDAEVKGLAQAFQQMESWGYAPVPHPSERPPGKPPEKASLRPGTALPPQPEGVLTVVSSRGTCDSCKYGVKDFQEAFPKISAYVAYETSANHDSTVSSQNRTFKKNGKEVEGTIEYGWPDAARLDSTGGHVPKGKDIAFKYFPSKDGESAWNQRLADRAAEEAAAAQRAAEEAARVAEAESVNVINRAVRPRSAQRVMEFVKEYEGTEKDFVTQLNKHMKKGILAWGPLTPELQAALLLWFKQKPRPAITGS